MPQSTSANTEKMLISTLSSFVLAVALFGTTYSCSSKQTDPELKTELDKPTRQQPKHSGSEANMVLIPAGKFRMGTDQIEDHDEAEPIHTVYLDAFYIDTHEVTLGEYHEFLLETGHPTSLPESVSEFSPTDRHPVVGVSWHDAMAYARWAGKRLPTEAEWERAARGGLIEAAYPWGDEEIDSARANYGNMNSGTVPVGSYEPNDFGLYDMAGNVSEWCLDPWDTEFYKVSPEENPFAGLQSLNETLTNFETFAGPRAVRGGSFLSEGSAACFVSLRHKVESANRYKNIGFRCVMEASP